MRKKTESLRAPKPGVIRRIEATGPTPKKQTGDYAQVSTGVTGSEVVTIGLIEWGIKWKRKTVSSTTTDNAGYEGKLGSTADWSATVKYAYVDGDASQTSVRAAITSLQTNSQKFNFFNTPESGRDSWSGNGIITGIDLATGVGKLFGMDITIEGDGPLNLIPQIATAAGTGIQPAVLAEN